MGKHSVDDGSAQRETILAAGLKAMAKAVVRNGHSRDAVVAAVPPAVRAEVSNAVRGNNR